MSHSQLLSNQVPVTANIQPSEEEVLSLLHRLEEIVFHAEPSAAKTASIVDIQAFVQRINALIKQQEEDERILIFTSEKKENGGNWSMFTTRTGASIGGYYEFKHYLGNASGGVFYKGKTLEDTFTSHHGVKKDSSGLYDAMYGTYNFDTDEWVWRYKAECTDPNLNLKKYETDNFNGPIYQLKFKGTTLVLDECYWYNGDLSDDPVGFTKLYG